MSGAYQQPQLQPGTSPVASLIGRLLWPERVPVTEPERQVASERIDHARAAGVLTGADADGRLGQLPAARTRADLRAVLRDLPGAFPSAGLPIATQVITALWLGATLIHFVIWLLVVLISRDWDNPWWLWPALVGAAITAGLWWATEGNYRSHFPPAPQGATSHA